MFHSSSKEQAAAAKRLRKKFKNAPKSQLGQAVADDKCVPRVWPYKRTTNVSPHLC